SRLHSAGEPDPLVYAPGNLQQAPPGREDDALLARSADQQPHQDWRQAGLSAAAPAGQAAAHAGAGRFDDLVRAITVDPAMLWWLDGRLSTGSNPNENYARELMELFTMGLSDAAGNPTYTQADVHQGALALTGWTVRRASLQSVLVPARQYTGM